MIRLANDTYEANKGITFDLLAVSLLLKHIDNEEWYLTRKEQLKFTILAVLSFHHNLWF